MAGRVEETYAAGLQHNIYRGDTTLVASSAAQPTCSARASRKTIRSWAPEALPDETKDRQEKLRTRGLCGEGAHNAALEDCQFAKRYRDYLDAEPPAALDALADRVHEREDIVLVCYEGDSKRCHRYLLLEQLARPVLIALPRAGRLRSVVADRPL